ncbi:unnamed protein product [Aphanomyces euteiches]|nr:hypothetical protein Ae201684P_008859 [Aphanomyces euteiches]KAH9113507.1 hypothetical protein AeMF1_012314 [Aphanomyces euteiches]KAH9134438.1 hypothetical protein AeRB84_019778 [Aphanomyces euteiches]KAH9135400.1 hypothetical protein LEN26_006429 [Aphanomyces euteiches]KAH9194710.1 hypothetical protein AeNC1_003311 [Aphanomyces euteiches]
MDRVRILFGGTSSSSAPASSAVEATVAAISIKMPKLTMSAAAAPPKEDTLSDSSFGCTSLTKTQRLYGFIICFCLGYFINLLATVALLGGSRNGAKFGIIYSVGSVVSLCGSGFLAGPMEQIKSMAKPVRRVASAIFLVSIILVLVVAITNPQLGLLVLFLAFLQFCAAVWYASR